MPTSKKILFSVWLDQSDMAQLKKLADSETSIASLIRRAIRKLLGEKK
jgi:hypothetical protein